MASSARRLAHPDALVEALAAHCDIQRFARLSLTDAGTFVKDAGLAYEGKFLACLTGAPAFGRHFRLLPDDVAGGGCLVRAAAAATAAGAGGPLGAAGGDALVDALFKHCVTSGIRQLSFEQAGTVVQRAGLTYVGKFKAFVTNAPTFSSRFVHVPSPESIKLIAAPTAGLKPQAQKAHAPPPMPNPRPGPGQFAQPPPAAAPPRPQAQAASTYAQAAALPVDADLLLSFDEGHHAVYRRADGAGAIADAAAAAELLPSAAAAWGSEPPAGGPVAIAGGRSLDIDPDLDSFLQACPPWMAAAVRSRCAALGRLDVCELVMDEGRRELELRFASDDDVEYIPLAAAAPALAPAPAQAVNAVDGRELGANPTEPGQRGSGSPADADAVTVAGVVAHWLRDKPASASAAFGVDNRLGIEGTLHRLSVMRGRTGAPLGITCRIGRGDVPDNAVVLLQDVLHRLVPPPAPASAPGGPAPPDGRGEVWAAPRAPASLLVLGPPSSGKTTLLRAIARALAGPLRLRVVVIDTSNEIGGDGDVPHPAIGRARRMQVPAGRQQADVMIEAIQVIIVDEIGRAAEVAAAKTIAQRGVALVATAHGVDLSSLLKNPPLAPLVGGLQAVTLGDAAVAAAARQAGAAREAGGLGAAPLAGKTRVERAGAPCFTVLVEMVARGALRLHRSTADAVDGLLLRGRADAELRWLERSSARGGRPGSPAAPAQTPDASADQEDAGLLCALLGLSATKWQAPAAAGAGADAHPAPDGADRGRGPMASGPRRLWARFDKRGASHEAAADDEGWNNWVKRMRAAE